MVTMRIGTRERRARLGLRHRLAPGSLASDPAEVARSLVAVHGTDPSSVYLGILARMASGGIESVNQALYTDRTLIRLLGMRRTVFVAPLDIASVIQAACSDAVAARERRKLLSWLAESGVGGDPDRWLTEVEQAALSALAARGEATAAELAAGDPRLRTQIVLSRGKSYEGRQNVSSRGAFPAGRAGPRGAGPPARLLDLAPVPLVAAFAVVPRRPGPLAGPMTPRWNWRGSGSAPTARPPSRTSAGGPAGARHRSAGCSPSSSRPRWISTACPASGSPTT